MHNCYVHPEEQEQHQRAVQLSNACGMTPYAASYLLKSVSTSAFPSTDFLEWHPLVHGIMADRY